MTGVSTKELDSAAKAYRCMSSSVAKGLQHVLTDPRKVIELPKLGHWPPFEAAQQTNAALLGFLDVNNQNGCISNYHELTPI